MTATPADYKLPHNSWYPNQLESIEAVRASTKPIVMLELPPGGGKSSLSLAIINSSLSEKHSAVVTHTKQLQDQYIRTFPDMGLVMGRNNFRCIIHDSMNCAEGPCSAGWKCEYVWSCPYHKQKAAAAEKKATIHNFAYWITEVNNVGVFSKLDWLILDEAQLVESGLKNHVSISLYQPVLHDLGIRPLYDEAPVEEWAEWADDNSTAVGQQVQKLQVDLEKYDIADADPTKLREIARKRRTLEELVQLSKIDDAWLSEVSNHPRYGKRFNFRPALVNTLGMKYIFRHAERVLMMSATILGIEPPCASLGIDPASVDFIQMPHSFPVENRLVYYRPSVKVKRGMPDSDIQQLVSDIDQVLFKYRGVKGLIHTSSYKLAKEIIARSKYAERLVSHNSSDRLESLDKFKVSTRDLVMVSPSMTTGVNLVEDECRFIIFAKIAFPDLGDKQIVKRMELPDGKEWYYWNTACTIVQASGRGVRSPTDHADTVLLDKNWDWFKHAARKFLPKWFMAAVRNGGQETAEETLKRVLATR
uniref:Putative helicase n=1 Tax=viral metagenome TaxID=1070528 RepID=A0A6M3LBU3_9ZZZZ